MLGLLLVLAAVMFRFIKLPRIASVESDEVAEDESIWSRRSLVLGALAIFLYVGGEVSIGSFLVNYFAETSIAGLSHLEAGEMVAYYWGAAMIGRLVGAAAMNYIAPTKYTLIKCIDCHCNDYRQYEYLGTIAMWSILAVGFFNSIMFPTIFTLAVKGLALSPVKGLVLFARQL